MVYVFLFNLINLLTQICPIEIIIEYIAVPVTYLFSPRKNQLCSIIFSSAAFTNVGLCEKSYLNNTSIDSCDVRVFQYAKIKLYCVTQSKEAEIHIL